MANLEPLIRLQKHTLDERRRFIARLYEEADKIYGHKNKMLDEVARERSYVEETNDPFVITGFLSYQGLAKKKIGMIDKEIERIEIRIEAAQDELREQFTELKKYEIVYRRRLEKQKDELRKREAALFDDIAIQGFHARRQELEEMERV